MPNYHQQIPISGSQEISLQHNMLWICVENPVSRCTLQSVSNAALSTPRDSPPVKEQGSTLPVRCGHVFYMPPVFSEKRCPGISNVLVALEGDRAVVRGDGALKLQGIFHALPVGRDKNLE